MRSMYFTSPPPPEHSRLGLFFFFLFPQRSNSLNFMPSVHNCNSLQHTANTQKNPFFYSIPTLSISCHRYIAFPFNFIFPLWAAAFIFSSLCDLHTLPQHSLSQHSLSISTQCFRIHTVKFAFCRSAKHSTIQPTCVFHSICRNGALTFFAFFRFPTFSPLQHSNSSSRNRHTVQLTRVCHSICRNGASSSLKITATFLRARAFGSRDLNMSLPGP